MLHDYYRYSETFLRCSKMPSLCLEESLSFVKYPLFILKTLLLFHMKWIVFIIILTCLCDTLQFYSSKNNNFSYEKW